MLPFVSFDIVSYAAGLTSMSFISFFRGNWCGTASGNDCIFLCWRNADRRSEASGDRTADPVCSVGTDFLMGRKIYMDRQNKKRKINGIKNVIIYGWDNDFLLYNL